MNQLTYKNKILISCIFLFFAVLIGAGLFLGGEDIGGAGVTSAGNTGNNPVDTDTAVAGGDGNAAEARAVGEDTLAAFLARSPAPPPASLEGTDVDGRVRADADGNLVLDPGVRDLFEYFLATLGEASLDDVRVWVAHHLNDNLPPRAARQGWELFNRYLDYRRQLADIPDPGLTSDAATMESAIRARQRLRREVLGQEAAESFFALDEAYDDYTLTRLAVMEDESLSEAQRAQRLEQARAELPEPLQRVREETTRPMRAREKVERMREEGASEAEIRAWREAELGAEAADRLEALEQRRRDWQRRYSAYREERSRMQLDGLAAPERAAALQRLREKHFDESEVRRVEALDRIREQQAGTRPDQ